jgi:transmembrane sensor
VVRDDRVFEVETHDARVHVLGTTFNVRAWRGEFEGATTVSLESGAVVLVPIADPGNAVEIAPGETWRVGTESGAVPVRYTVPVDVAASWRVGDLIFHDRRLDTIISDVERRFGVRILIAPDNAGSQRFSVALREPRDVETVLSDIAAAVGLRYRERSDGFELFRQD